MNKEELIGRKEEMIRIMTDVGYSDDSIKKCSSKISIYIDYLEENKLQPDDDSIQYFIDEIIKNNNKDSESNYVKCTKRVLNKFLFFLENGCISQNRPYVNHNICNGMAGSMNKFLEHLENKIVLSPATVKEYRFRLKTFNDYMKENRIELCEKTIYDFFIYLESIGSSCFKVYAYMIQLKKYFLYLYDNDYSDTDYSVYLPKVKYIRQQKLPSVFSVDEIKKILIKIDRNSVIGKRDYAMVILAVRYGLRSSDVVGLRFENIDWDNNLISLEQDKTKRMVEFPLLPEVGNAILDYIKVRRQSSQPFVFVQAKGPISKLSSSAFYNILNNYIRLANIAGLEKRKHGPHSLRHSLASELLKEGSAIETISSILGHSSSQVTTVYLSIDFDSLRKCALEMPGIHSDIYREVNRAS